MYTYSSEHSKYLKKIQIEKIFVIAIQLMIIISFIVIWQILVDKSIINSFLFSSPLNVIDSVIELYKTNSLFSHIWITIYETLIGFCLTSIIGLVIGSLLWQNRILAKIVDPYLTIINSLPKVALGPLIIIWVGADIDSIIFMALMISSIISIINMYNAFNSTDKNYINLLKSFGANKFQIYKKVILPSNFINIINILKINISMTLIGIIMGELLVSKKGLGYLIMYGSQVFNIDLVISGVFILGILSWLMYYIVSLFEKHMSNIK